MLLKVPYPIEWDEEKLYLHFLSRVAEIAWSDIEWFVKFWVMESSSHAGRGRVAMLARYQRPNGKRVMILLGLPGIASSDYSIRPKDYVTVFDTKIKRGAGRSAAR